MSSTTECQAYACFAVAAAQNVAADDIGTSITAMSTRTRHSTHHCAQTCDEIQVRIMTIRDRLHAELRFFTRKCDKMLDEKAEEADTAAKQLAAVFAMCFKRVHIVDTLRWSSFVSDLANGGMGDVAQLRVPVSTLTPST